MSAIASTRKRTDTSLSVQAEAPEADTNMQTWLPLLEEALRREGFFRWRLRGASMWPTLSSGSDILIKPKPHKLRLGEVVVFAQGDALIAHRLVHRRRSGWVTQGDARRTPDPPHHPEDVLGIVVSSSVGGECYWPSHRSILTTPYWIMRYHAFRLLRYGLRGLYSFRRHHSR